jgi:hypothetical protein
MLWAGCLIMIMQRFELERRNSQLIGSHGEKD